MTTTQESKIWSRRLLFIALASVMLLFAGGGFLLWKTLNLQNYKTEILEMLQGTLHRRVLYESGSFSFRFTPSFTFNKITIMEKDGSEPFLTADRLTFKIALLPLLDKKLALRGISLEKPSVVIKRDRSGMFNISDLLKGPGGEMPLQARGISIRKGTFRFFDQGVGPREVMTTLEGLDLSVNRFVRGKTTGFKLSASVTQGKQTGGIQINGTLALPPEGKSFTETSFDGSIKATNLIADHFWDYYSRYVPFRKAPGSLDLNTTFTGKLSEFSSRGSVKISDLRFDYPEVFHAVLTPKNVSFQYDMDLTPRDITVKALDLNVDALNVKGSCALKDITSNDPYIEARAKTSFFHLEDFASYIPFGVIADDASHYIEDHIKGGTYQLEEGSLIGHVSQIVHMEKGTNYNVLFIKGTVDKGIVSYGQDVPTFNSIKGNLAMRGKDFVLTGMQGKFGESPFTLDGRITDYPLDSPCGYPFTMTMKARPAEISWLLGGEKKTVFGFSGDSILSLQGSGPTSGYSLSGDWDLSSTAYSFRDMIAKKAGVANKLSFQSILNDRGAKITAFSYNMTPLIISGSAEYGTGRKRPLSFSVRSNDFPIREVASRFPRIARYQPAGRVRLAIHGTADYSGKEGPLLDGEITLAGVSCRPSESMKRLTDINGTVILSGETLKTSELSARLGTSTIAASGTLTGFDSPVLSFDFSSPAIDPADIGLRSPKEKIRIEKVRGNLTFREDTLTINALSARINHSTLSIKGTVKDPRNPDFRLELGAKYLDMEDMTQLANLERDDSEKTGEDRSSFHVTVNAEAGKFHQVDFTKLHADVHLDQKILYIEDVGCDVMKGRFTGNGRVDFGTAGGPRYQISLQLKKISAAHLLQTFGTDRELTGSISIEGDLIARGETLDQIKATSLGNLRLHCERGTLRKFSLLSKLFSILNVSQLFTFQLPDMVSNGMPYNEIKASFSLRDGVVSTDDLFIDSNAMSISLVGEFDLVKDQLNVTVGVKPLQTIDKVVSRIPVVGWVLTGKKRSLITTYFQATGSLDNPQVKSITVKSMAKGVFNIFSRLFSLPAKLVTNTGEVIINQ